MKIIVGENTDIHPEVTKMVSRKSIQAFQNPENSSSET
jgi:hypothetical protein